MKEFSQSATEVLPPYEYEEDALNLKLKEVKLMRESEDSKTLSASGGKVNLSDRDFDTAEISGSVELPEKTYDSVLPREEAVGEPPLKLVIAVRCSDTFKREKAFEAEVPDVEGEVEFVAELNRTEFRGAARLVPFLVRSEDSSVMDSTYAIERSKIVADGGKVRIYFDESDREMSDILDFKPVSFEDEEMKRFGVTGDEVFYLDHSEEPTVYLNGDAQGLKQALNYRGTSAARTALRRAVADLISIPVWTELIEQAVMDLKEDRREFRHDWQEDVMSTFLEDITPDDLETEAEMIEHVRSKKEGDLSDMHMLISRIQSAVQQDCKVAENTERLILEVWD